MNLSAKFLKLLLPATTLQPVRRKNIGFLSKWASKKRKMRA